MDLFYLRETSQKKLEKSISEGSGNLNEFGREQLEITKCILERITPKVIVVANAFASRIYKKEY